MKLAIIEHLGKQFILNQDSIIYSDKIDHEEGKEYVFSNVLLINEDNNKTLIGQPYLKNAIVKGIIEKHGKPKKNHCI